jgi:hypothetical protein
MESWRQVFRDGFAPIAPKKGLEAVRQALLTEDGALVRGTTTMPPLTLGTERWRVEAACLVGMCYWRGEDLHTVAETQGAFGQACLEIDQRLKEPAACRYLLAWFDEAPWDEVVAGLLEEIDRELKRRADG